MHRPSEGGEKWIDNVVPVHEYGFVTLVDYMGNDDRIVEAARQSTTGDVKDPEKDRVLIRYLLDPSHRPHTSPFEMVELCFKVRLPIFVARQWIRHRTANVNEYSGRYSVLPDEAWVPTDDRVERGAQDTVNRQGSKESSLSDVDVDDVRFLMAKEQANAFESYRTYLEGYELSKELARINLPLSTYTTWMWKIDLHNLFHFLWLRTDGHAQEEIRDYANIIEQIVADVVPVAYEAWVDFKKEAVTLSRMQREELIGTALYAEDFDDMMDLVALVLDYVGDDDMIRRLGR